MTDADRAREQQIRKRTESHHCVGSSDTLFVLDQLAAERQAREALEQALEWLVNLGHGVGKAGGSPEFGEFEEALNAGRVLLHGTGE